ncbi:MAG: tRNA dihydrouridine synthase DusB [Ruminococcaceae bacterium]|nr:tRNA dihydrouridine synthase DusB [Oscillospiraceae bacterium]
MNIIKSFKTPPLILAPMAGVADNAFRILCKKHGADMVFSEMVSAKAVYYGDKKTYALASFRETERPYILQIFGSEPHILAHAARVLYDFCRPDGIDINMGCPVHKIFANNEGSALMKSPEAVYEIVSRVKDAVPVPVSVKIRSGIDKEHINALEVALSAQKGGADFVSIHARTRAQMYAGKADYKLIKELNSALDIPLIGNGDVTDTQSLDAMLETGVSGVMIGRGALGNPFIFARLKSHMLGEAYTEPDRETIKNTLFEHLNLSLEFKPEKIAVREARKHIAYYLKGFPGSAALRDAVNRADTVQQLFSLLNS